MDKVSSQHSNAQVSSFKMLKAMVGIGVMCALMIVLTFETTLPAIEKNKAEALEKAIFKVLPGIDKKQTFQLTPDQTFDMDVVEGSEAQKVYAGYDVNNNLVGFVIEASGMGFADILKILYGYDPQAEKVVGFYVLESKETPGLGDKIEKDDGFLTNFEALDVQLNEAKNGLRNTVIPVKQGEKENPWEVDCITGATISSRAIGNIIGESTQQLIPLIYNSLASFALDSTLLQRGQ